MFIKTCLMVLRNGKVCNSNALPGDRYCLWHRITDGISGGKPRQSPLFNLIKSYIFVFAIVTLVYPLWKWLRSPSIVRIIQVIFMAAWGLGAVSFTNCFAEGCRRVWPKLLLLSLGTLGILLCLMGAGYYYSPSFYAEMITILELKSVPPRLMMAACTAAFGVWMLLYSISILLRSRILIALMWPFLVIGIGMPLIRSFSAEHPILEVLVLLVLLALIYNFRFGLIKKLFK
ncbi:MAG: hypothetical protein MN733_06945 [Nitrososphaera sp.]|nr:hypothetical protein [Nitrososphaera sp.]